MDPADPDSGRTIGPDLLPPLRIQNPACTSPPGIPSQAPSSTCVSRSAREPFMLTPEHFSYDLEVCGRFKGALEQR